MTRKRARLIALVAAALVIVISGTALAAPYGSRTLYTGSFGGDVAELQRRLTSLGFYDGRVDGIFGSQTKGAVLHFEQQFGLAVDGMADKWVYQSIDRAYSWQHGVDYTVQTGDTLQTLADRFGTRPESITWLNALNSSVLMPGQVVRIPADAKTPPAAAAPTPAPAPAPTPAPTPAPVVAPRPMPLPSGSAVPVTAQTVPSAPTPAPTSAPTTPADPTTPPAPTPTTDLPPATTSAPPSSYTVLGYYAEDWQGDPRSLGSLQASGGGVNLVVNFELQLDATGAVTTRSYPNLTAEAKKEGLKVQGLVHNYNAGSFDPAIARTVLSDPAVEAKAVSNLVQVAKDQGLAGINVDIENVAPELRQFYTKFAKDLSAALKAQGLSLSLSVPAQTEDDQNSGWSGAFDYAALGQYADFVIPMAYDEHLPGFPAGPVASESWVDRVASYAASVIPPEKVLLGVPMYAYNWQAGTTNGWAMSVPAAEQLATTSGATVQWDPNAMVPYFTYVDGGGQERIVYFENAKSLAPKIDLVKRHGLGGIAIWRLGLEDPSIWPLVHDTLK